MKNIAIRCDGGEHLTITLWYRSHPDCTDYWDGNWLRTSVDVAVGGFQATTAGDLRAEELVAFYDQFTEIQESLTGSITFVTMEEWLSIQIEGNGRGQMKCQCVLRDQPGIGNTLHFTLFTDQTFTRTTLAELADAVHAFPIIGNPSD